MPGNFIAHLNEQECELLLDLASVPVPFRPEEIFTNAQTIEADELNFYMLFLGLEYWRYLEKRVEPVGKEDKDKLSKNTGFYLTSRAVDAIIDYNLRKMNIEGQ